MWSEDNSCGVSSLFLPLCDFLDGTQVIRLTTKCLYSVSHHPSPVCLLVLCLCLFSLQFFSPFIFLLSVSKLFWGIHKLFEYLY